MVATFGPTDAPERVADICAGNVTSARRKVRSGGIRVLDFVGVVKVFARRGGESQGLGETLSEAGFTGFLGISGTAGNRLMPVQRILFAWSERADCRGTINWDVPRSLGLSQISWWTLSEAGFTGLLGIFGIAGSRLMPVWRILFKSGERADCRGAIMRDLRVKAGLSLASGGRCLSQD